MNRTNKNNDKMRYNKDIVTSTFLTIQNSYAFFVGKETEMQEKEMKLMELQEMYETRLLSMKVG